MVYIKVYKFKDVYDSMLPKILNDIIYINR